MPKTASSQNSGFDTGIRGFFTGAGFPVFVLSAVAVYEGFLLLVVFAPLGGPFADFAREFKQWCFDFDPRTGGMQWAAVWVMLVEPPFIAGIAVLLWRSGLKTLRTAAACLAQWRAATAGVLFASIAVGGLYAFGKPSSDEFVLPPFPGERIRTQLQPPAFQLVDHAGVSFGLGDMRGRVIIMTGVYTLCSTSCPEILLELRALLDGLPAADRAVVSVAALSLNPEYDTSERMGAVASAYGFTHPEFRYLNGDPAIMHDLLTRLQFSAVRNPQTGVIDHANLFIVVDAQGRIAYRFSLDPRNRTWLRAAVMSLTAEARGVRPPLADL